MKIKKIKTFDKRISDFIKLTGHFDFYIHPVSHKTCWYDQYLYKLIYASNENGPNVVNSLTLLKKQTYEH